MLTQHGEVVERQFLTSKNGEWLSGEAVITQFARAADNFENVKDPDTNIGF